MGSALPTRSQPSAVADQPNRSRNVRTCRPERTDRVRQPRRNRQAARRDRGRALSSPASVHPTKCRSIRRADRRRRVEQIYDDALAGIETEHVRGVEWRIKQSTKVFREPDPHRGNLVYRHVGRVTLHEFLQIVRRATIGRDLISTDLLNAHLSDWGVYGRDSGRVELLDERRRRAGARTRPTSLTPRN